MFKEFRASTFATKVSFHGFGTPFMQAIGKKNGGGKNGGGGGQNGGGGGGGGGGQNGGGGKQ